MGWWLTVSRMGSFPCSLMWNIPLILHPPFQNPFTTALHSFTMVKHRYEYCFYIVVNVYITDYESGGISAR